MKSEINKGEVTLNFFGKKQITHKILGQISLILS